LICQGEAKLVMTQVEQIAQTGYQPQHDQDVGKRTDANASISFFQPSDGVRGRAGARSQVSRRDPPPDTGRAHIPPQLGQG
jgi:hypothetical protein